VLDRRYALAVSVELGQKVRDSVTGVEGTVTAITRYLAGCVRVAVELVNREGAPKEYWFDEPRLDATSEATGGGNDPPARTAG
jgi:hypothetical protein